jgi:hypothetical protein
MYAPACHVSCLYLAINDGLDFPLQRQYSVSGLTCVERGMKERATERRVWIWHVVLEEENMLRTRMRAVEI